MAKTKKNISGKRIAPGVFEVDSSRKKDLIQGQKVLIYKPTSKAIVGLTGRVIGHKERVIGVGEVDVVGDKVVVKTYRTGSRKLLGVKNGIVNASKSHRVRSQTLSSSKLKLNTGVYIKAVEE